MTEQEMIRKIQGHCGAKVDGVWGPKTKAAVAAKLGCPNSVKGIQKAVDITADGIVGPITIEAVFKKFITVLNEDEPICKEREEAVKESAKPCHYDVILDPGHTADFAREHPCQFTNGLWESGKGFDVAKILGFDKKTDDSVEHILNVLLAHKTAAYLESKGIATLVIDTPEMENNKEITKVYTEVNKLKPKVFVSIHNNACGCSGAKSCACTASGTVSFYCRQNSKALADKISSELVTYRNKNNGPHNRAQSVVNKGYTVISKTCESVKSCLVEVGFYDNMNDLWFMSQNLTGLGEAIGRGIEKVL